MLILLGRFDNAENFFYSIRLRMKTIFKKTIILIMSFLTLSCSQEPADLTEAQKTEIADSAREVLKKVFEYPNKLDFKTGLQFYSGNPDTRYIDNGSIYPSLDAMKEAYDQVGPTMELVRNNVQSWDAVVLAKDAVSFTLPIQLTLKAKGRPEYTGQYIWSGILQKRNGKWMIIQSHESWLNYADVIAALSQPVAKY